MYMMVTNENEFHIIHIMEGIYVKEQYKIIVLSDELSKEKIQKYIRQKINVKQSFIL